MLHIGGIYLLLFEDGGMKKKWRVATRIYIKEK